MIMAQISLTLFSGFVCRSAINNSYRTSPRSICNPKAWGCSVPSAVRSLLRTWGSLKSVWIIGRIHCFYAHGFNAHLNNEATNINIILAVFSFDHVHVKYILIYSQNAPKRLSGVVVQKRFYSKRIQTKRPWMRSISLTTITYYCTLR